MLPQNQQYNKKQAVQPFRFHILITNSLNGTHPTSDAIIKYLYNLIKFAIMIRSTFPLSFAFANNTEENALTVL